MENGKKKKRRDEAERFLQSIIRLIRLEHRAHTFQNRAGNQRLIK